MFLKLTCREGGEMLYKKLGILEEVEYRLIWKEEYCNIQKPILTFDNMRVKFFEDQFDHAFFESDNRTKKDKAIFSLNRATKMLWIKSVLQDPEALLKEGWDKSSKSYLRDRRTAILIRKSYLVVIRFIKDNEAKFVTAYEIDDVGLEKVLKGPEWTKK